MLRILKHLAYLQEVSFTLLKMILRILTGPVRTLKIILRILKYLEYFQLFSFSLLRIILRILKGLVRISPG